MGYFEWQIDKHKFELENDIAGMPKQDILIYLQNIVGYFKFLMRDQGFWHNQSYKPSHISNGNENWVYSEMNTGK